MKEILGLSDKEMKRIYDILEEVERYIPSVGRVFSLDRNTFEGKHLSNALNSNETVVSIMVNLIEAQQEKETNIKSKYIYDVLKKLSYPEDYFIELIKKIFMECKKFYTKDFFIRGLAHIRCMYLIQELNIIIDLLITYYENNEILNIYNKFKLYLEKVTPLYKEFQYILWKSKQ